MKHTGNKLAWVAGAMIVAVMAVLLMRPKPIPVDTAPVVVGPMTVTVEEEGETRLHDNFVISAPVAGRLLRIELRAGDAVSSEETVARIEPAPIDPRYRAELTAQVQAAEAGKQEAAALAERAQSDYGQARRNLDRAEKLAASGVISKEALEQAHTAEAASVQALEAARHRLAATTSEEEAARARLLDARRSRGAAVVEVNSPIAGKVLRLLQQSERVVTAGTPLLELGYSPRLEVVTDVLSSEAVKVQSGDPVLLEGWGGERPIRARVRLVEPSGFTKVSALGIEEQRVNVVIDFVDPPGPLGDAYRVEARIIVWQSERVTKAPTSALFRQGTEWAVFVLQGDRATRRQVEIGHRNATEAEVLKGVATGEQVVLHPTNEIRDGVRITAR